jgi:hypothetical protein
MLMAALLFAFALQSLSFAATPDDYQKRVKAAKARVDSLFQTISDGEYADENLNELSVLLPANEKIDWPHGTVETSNRWLLEHVEKFNAAPDDQERGMVLTQISEQLGAISESIDHLKGAAQAELTKDQDKQKLAEILRREEYQKPAENEESFLEKWWNEFLEWLLGAFPRPSVSPGTDSGLGSLQLGLQILVYALVIGFIGFLIYKIAPFLFRRFESKERKERKHRVILGERIEADESASDLFGEAEQLARSGDLRAAIRKGYIALLCDLSDRKVIRLAHHKTNRDYLRDIKTNEGLFNNVNGLTRNFERNWYGLRPADEGDWEDFRRAYLQTIADVKR